jgi:protein-L-isoaspartate(D-aspartate) O-methyltransferase
MPDQRVEKAFEATPRAGFLPRRQRRFAGLDRPLEIGHGQTNSQPTTVRHLLTLLDVPVGARVLDVGCGSGWTTVLLARLVGPSGMVIGVELLPDLVTFGRANLARHPVPWARIEAARSDVLGLPEEAPYDRILVSAEAEHVPDALVAQLAPHGLMVVPVTGRLCTVRRPADWPRQEADVVPHGHYAFVPLREPRPERGDEGG